MWDIRPLLTLSFWFDVNPPPLLPFFEKAFFILYGAALFFAIVLGISERRQKQLLSRTFHSKTRRCVTTLGIVGLVLSFFNYERTVFLSMRFWTLLLWGGVVVWAGLILYWEFWVRPRLSKSAAERKTFEQYLPK